MLILNLVCLLRITILKSVYWVLALFLSYYTFAYKTCLNKFDEMMTRITPNKRIKSIKIGICLYTALSIIIKTSFLLNYWLTLDQLNDGILFKSEFLQIEIFGDKLVYKPAFKQSYIAMKYFILEIVLENSIFIFTLLFTLNPTSEDLNNQENDLSNKGIYNNLDENANKDPNNVIEVNQIQNKFQSNFPQKKNEQLDFNSNYPKNTLQSQKLKKELKSYLDQKFFLYGFQFIVLAILSLLNVTLLNLSVFISLILMMAFSIFLPNSFNSLDRVNKAFGIFTFLILSINYIKNTELLKNAKDDYMIGIINFEVVNSFTYFTLLYLSYVNCLCIQFYDISDEEFTKIEEDVEKRIIEEMMQENINYLATKTENAENEQLNEQCNKSQNENNIILKTQSADEDDLNLTTKLKRFFFLISPLLYKVILLMWILFHVCLIMFVNFVILFFAIEKAKKYFKLYYLIPSFIVCILFTTLQFTFNMNGFFYFDNIKTYKILEIVGIYKIYKTEITEFSNINLINTYYEAKFSGMLFNIISMSLLYCFGLALSVSSEDEQISASKKQQLKNKEENFISNNNQYQTLVEDNEEKKEQSDKNKDIHVLDEVVDKKDLDINVNTILVNNDNNHNKDIINTEPIIKELNNEENKIDYTLKENIESGKYIKNEKQIEIDKDNNNMTNNSNLSNKEKSFIAKMKLQLQHFWIEKSYLGCIVITFICSVIKFDLLHIIYFVYFIILLCLGDKGFKPVWDNLMLINRIIIIIILYFWNILAVNFLDLEKETNPEVENIFTYLGLKINKNSIFFLEYWEYILLYLFGYLHNYFVVYWYIYIVNSDNKNNINISIENSLNSSYLENEKIASVKHIYRFPEWTRKITIILVVFLMVELAFIRPLSFQGLLIFILSLVFVTTNLFIISDNKKHIIRGLIKALIIISIISIVLKYCINFSFMVNYLKELLNLEDFIPLEDKVNNLLTQNTNRLLSGSSTVTEEESLNFYNIGMYNTNNNDIDNPNLKNFSLQDFGLDVKNFKLKLFINFIMILAMKILYSYSYYHDEEPHEENKNAKNTKIKKNNYVEFFDQKFDDENGPSIIDYISIKIKISEIGFIKKFQEILTYIYVFISQLIYLHSCKIMFLVAVFVCVSIESMIGVILFGVILISLFMERHSGWRYSFFPLILISIMVMSFVYVCKMNAFKKWMTKDYEWFGLYNPKSNSIFGEEFPYIIVLFISYLSRIANSFKIYFDAYVLEKENKEENLDERIQSDKKIKKDKVLSNFFQLNQNIKNQKSDVNNTEYINDNNENKKKKVQFENFIDDDIVKEDKIKANEDVKIDEKKSDDLEELEKKNKIELESLSSMKKITDLEKYNEDLKHLVNQIGAEYSDKKYKKFFDAKNNLNLKDLSYIKMTYDNDNKIEFSEVDIEAITLFSKFWIKLDFLWYLYGFYVVLITIMLIAFIKVNLLSLCLMIFVGYQSFGKYIRTEFITEKEENNKENLKFLRKYWFFFAVFLAIFSFMQYINYMWFPPSWKIAKPWEHSSFLCSRDGKSIYSNNVNFKNNSDFDYCVTDWKAWLNIDNYSTKDIFYNFICLFMLLISNKYLTSEELPYKKREKFIPEKSNNFTIAKNRHTFWDTLIFISFVYLKSLILFCIIIMSIVYTYKYTNVIYSGFMFISFYMLFKDSYLIKKKNELWKIVQFYNFFVLVFFMLFQTPFFPCPINRDGRSYVGLDECVEEENKLYKSFLLFEYPKYWDDALYMVAVQTIGLLKLDFKLLVVGNLSLFLIYIVALIQQIIFDHPYQYFVDEYLEVEKNINCKSRAFKLVQDSHLNLKCDYRKIHTNMEILDDKLIRLKKKTNEYAKLWDQKVKSDINQIDDSNRDNDKKIDLNEDTVIVDDRLLEEINILIENALNENDLGGEVDYFAVKAKVKDLKNKLLKESSQIPKEKPCVDNEINPKVGNDNLNQENDVDKIKNFEEINDENVQLIQNNTNLNITSLAPKDLKRLEEVRAEENLKNELMKRLIIELDNLITVQRKKDKLNLYKSENHGLVNALPIYKKIIESNDFKESYRDELILLKSLFRHPNSKYNINNYHSNFTSFNPDITNRLNDLNEPKLQHSYTEQCLSNNEIKLNTEKYKFENKSNISFNNNKNKNNNNNDNLNNSYFNNKEEVNENPNSQSQLPEEKKEKSEGFSTAHFVALLYEMHSKHNNTGLVNNNLQIPKDGNFINYIHHKLLKAIDNILLIDLSSTSPFRAESIVEVLLYWIYSKIEIIIVIAFIINMCVDASVISMVYPISYFGYALLEYPFTNKYYWKFLTIYSLVTIVLKLFYQLPFICGYPFLAFFNPFSDNFCETYNLSETDFLDNFEYFLGLRKYNGEYSYPKNAGLLSGILWDIIILFLLLCKRSLLKSKGIWNFIDIHKEFEKVPVFINGKNSQKDVILSENDIEKNMIDYPNENILANQKNKNNNENCEIATYIPNQNPNINHHKPDEKNDINEDIIDIKNDGNNFTLIKPKNDEIFHEQNINRISVVRNSRNNNNRQYTIEDIIREYIDSIINFSSVFFRRLAPELYYNEGKQISKPGVDYYPHTFACLLVILIYTLFFFGSITGRNGQSFTDILDKQQFSKDIVWTTIIIIIIIVVDRVIYKYRSVNTKFITDSLNIKKDPKNNDGNKSPKNIDPTKSPGVVVLQTQPNNSTNNYVPIDTKMSAAENKNNRESDNVLNHNFMTKEDVDNSNLALIIKLILHYFLLLFTHYFIFIKLPLTTRIYFFQNSSLIILYILCCIYFYLTSIQIKYGFPLITKGQYFASSTKLYNRLAFKIYRNVPFLYELRAILDWTITKTSLDLFQWFKLEDAYATLYEVKCDMAMRKDRKKGEDRWWLEKFSWGFCFFIFLMFILILPMILFSSFNPNLVENKVLGGKFSVNLELRNPELDVTTFTLNLFQVNTLKINKIKNPAQYSYLKNTLIPQVDDVEERKIQKTKIINYSQLDWILSPPTIRELLTNLEKKSDCFINIEWEFRREFPPNNRHIQGSRSNQLSRDQISMLRYIIFSLKTHQKPEKFKLDIKDAFPKIIRLANKQYRYVKFDSKHKTQHKEFTDIQLQLIKENERDIYWKINQVDIKNITDSPFYNKNDELSFILINDDVISSFFGFNSDGGMPLSIIGIYATLVYTVGKFIRIFFDKISQRVIYEEMPEPNDLFELCEGIYNYRNRRDLIEERRLYDLLVRIYRSPETLIKITLEQINYNDVKKEEKNKK